MSSENFPTKEEIERRRKICLECPDKVKADWIASCRFCGCSISGLVKFAKQCKNAAAPRW
jgi:hypothetical protein